jgi:glucose-6-phosphate isomerase
MIRVSGPSLTQVDRSSQLYALLERTHLRIAKMDATTWGQDAQAEASNRLNWVNLPQSSKALLPELVGVVETFKGIKHLVLCGMGGSSLAPEVIARTYEKKIFILDSTDPNYIAHVNENPLNQTLVIISSKSGSTIEIECHKAYFEDKLRSSGLNPVDHILLITDPSSPLDIEGRKAGYVVVNADPQVGGRFSALTAFGLAPAALMGTNPSVLLDQAESAKENFLTDPSAILDVAYVLTKIAGQFIGFTDTNSKVPGLADWIEQLIAESTGKNEKGRLPIATEDISEAAKGGALSVAFAPDNAADLVVEAELGAHFIFWEWVTALVAAALEVDPFNQPNVTEAKEATTNLLEKWGSKLPETLPDGEDAGVEIFGHGATLTSALKNLIANTDSDGYIAIMAYLDRIDDFKIHELRSIISEKSGRPVSFGWGPRFMHSTGQFHKGGQQNGSFLQITGETLSGFKIPGKDFDFKTLLMAQALGDAQALEKRKYPLLRLHLQDRSAGIDLILIAARSL